MLKPSCCNWGCHCVPQPRSVQVRKVEDWRFAVCSWIWFQWSNKGPKAKFMKDISPVTAVQLQLGSLWLILHAAPSLLCGDTSSTERLQLAVIQ